MKQFNRKIHLALLGGALLGAAWLPSAATAKPFPKRGYILEAKGAADIGRRASTLDAQRAALRMMARMMKWTPKEDVYSVGWTTFDNNGEDQLGWASFGVEEEQLPPTEPQEPSLITTGRAIYWPVNRRIISRVASYNGSFRDLTRYGNTTGPDDININLGTYGSYDAGSRATLRVLAKHMKSPFNSLYSITWSYPLKENVTDEITVSYNPSMEDGILNVQGSARLFDNDYGTRDSFHKASKQSISKVARICGTFQDLVKFGAEDYFRSFQNKEAR